MPIKHTKYWKVGDLAKLTGLTIRTLRYYDQIGLFSPSGYSQIGHRLYVENDLVRLQQILTLKDLGLSLDEIKSIVDEDDYDPSTVVKLQIDRLKDNIRNQQKLLKELLNVSSLMRMEEPVSLEDFTQLLSMMKKNHENYFNKRRRSMEHHFDLLGNFLIKHPNPPDQRRK